MPLVPVLEDQRREVQVLGRFMRTNPEMLEFIQARYLEDPVTKCWNWTAGCNPGGYGVICQYTGNRTQKTSLAHRVSYTLHHGCTPKAVLHRCNNPKCVNPAHLYAGTAKDNYADQRRADTNIRGDRCHLTKLSTAAVQHIRASTLPRATLATQFNVTYSTIWRIQQGKIWQHLVSLNHQLSELA